MPSKELLPQEGETISLGTHELESANCRKLDEYEDKLIDHKVLKSYVSPDE